MTTCPTCGGSGIVPGVDSRLRDERTLSDQDQTASDQDQTWSDHDQTASDSDSESAAEDQAASDSDLEAGGDPSQHERTRTAREHAASTRDDVSALRDATAAARLATAAERDRAADERDRIAAERDRLAAESDARAGLDIGEMRAQAARDRARAAADRARAAADRAAAAGEREAARAVQVEAERQVLLAATDELTGAWTRRYGLIQVERELERARRTGEPLTIAFVDVDRLKEVNDESGHAAGDRLLRLTADTMRANLRPYDVVVRLGGDEFLCAMPGLGTSAARERMTAIAATMAVSQPGHSISFGLAEHEHGVEVDTLIGRVDADLLAGRRTSGESD